MCVSLRSPAGGREYWWCVWETSSGLGWFVGELVSSLGSPAGASWAGRSRTSLRGQRERGVEEVEQNGGKKKCTDTKRQNGFKSQSENGEIMGEDKSQEFQQ